MRCFPFTHDWAKYWYRPKLKPKYGRRGAVYTSKCRKCGAVRRKVLK